MGRPHICSVTGDGAGALVTFADGPPMKVKERLEVIAKEIDRWMVAVYFGERSER